MAPSADVSCLSFDLHPNASLTQALQLRICPQPWPDSYDNVPGTWEAGFAVGSGESAGWSPPLLLALRRVWAWEGSLGAPTQGGGCSLRLLPGFGGTFGFPT